MKRPSLTIKGIAWAIVVLLFLGVAALALFVASEWTYISRLRHHPANSILNVEWYVPKEVVRGGRGSPFDFSSVEGDPRLAFAEAAKLAESKNAAALLIIQQGRVARLAEWQGHHASDWTNSASMAKSITALLIGIALDEGKLGSLDEPAAKWIPTWRDDARRLITLRHLLQMHAGLKPMGKYEDPFSDASYLALGTDLRYVVDNVPPVTEAGRHFDYNNVNFQALGFVLEAATGRRYADYLSEKLWQPIGAADAALWLDREGGSAHASGYLFATVWDWGRVGQLLLQEGEWDGKQVVSRDYLHAMLKPSPSEPTYGLGIWLANDDHQRREAEAPFLAPGIFYLDGRFKQRVYVIPSHEIVIVRVGENARGWEEAALPNAVLQAVAQELDKPSYQPQN